MKIKNLQPTKVIVSFFLLGLSVSSFASVVGTPVQPACLKASVSVSDPNNLWYTEVLVNVKNTCSTTIELDKASLSFKTNTQGLGAAWSNGTIISSQPSYENGVMNTVLQDAGAGQSWGTGHLTPNSTPISIHFGANLNGEPFDVTNANNSIELIPQGTTPVKNDGEIDIQVNPLADSGDLGSESIHIISGTYTKTINNTEWTSTSTYKLTDLSYGDYTVTADQVPGYNVFVTPSTVTVNGATPQTVTLTYQALQKVGSINVTLPVAPLAYDIADTTTITVTDTKTDQQYTKTSAWGSATVFDNLPAGDNYSISVPEMTNGSSIAMPKMTPSVIQDLKENSIGLVKVSYTTKARQTMPVTFIVNGLSEGETDAVLNLTDKDGYTYKFSGLSNGLVQKDLPLNNTYTLSASAPNLTAKVDPSTFTIGSKNSIPPSINVNFVALPASTGLLVGYLDLSAGNDPTIMDAVNHGYNVVIIGWGSVEGTAVDVYSDSKQNDPNLVADIKAAHDKGAKVLLSFGGMNNTFAPPANASDSEAQTIAKGMVAIANQYGFDGVDFDVENISAGQNAYTTDFVEALIRDIKVLNPNLWITGAPQVFGMAASGWNYMGFAPNGNSSISDWNKLIASDLFDYIWVQDYNQGGGAQIDSNIGPAHALTDNEPGFLAASYEAAMNGCIPNEKDADGQLTVCTGAVPTDWTMVAFSKLHTQFIIGVPSVLNDWRGANGGVANPVDIVQQFNCLRTGQECTSYKPTKTYKPAGLMAWSVAGDKLIGWKFSSGVKVCILNGQCG